MKNFYSRVLLRFVVITATLTGCKDLATGADNTSGGGSGGGCSLTEVAEGAMITCGNASTLIKHGSNGTNGSNGAAGAQGPQGSQGAQGAQGPRGDVGPSGAGVPHTFWLAYMDGSPIAEIIDGHTGYFKLWDDENELIVEYTSRAGTKLSISSGSSFYPTYATTDCTGTVYSSSTSLAELGNLPGTAIGLGGKFFKILETTEVITPRSYQAETDAGTLNCLPLTNRPARLHFRIQEITSNIPFTLEFGTYKVIRQ